MPSTTNAGLDLFQNHVSGERDPGFENAGEADFRLRPGAELFNTVGFKAIPFEEIGLYDSPARASWPVETTPVSMPDWRDR